MLNQKYSEDKTSKSRFIFNTNLQGYTGSEQNSTQ